MVHGAWREIRGRSFELSGVIYKSIKFHKSVFDIRHSTFMSPHPAPRTS
ncbi:hypothetical protein D1AOALGA4SA_8189 [Olavius algarvensis Delta 1 endosymbiont]|nr:hypothetical protein D1AOALGA4SA_8189 [Olavius algarvensis Delta 1 endosymbiont]